MATCKDCIHKELCNTHGYIDADECGCFKNKADFVEVVRCRKCKYQDECWQKVDCEYALKEIVYCSYGEPKDGLTKIEHNSLCETETYVNEERR